MIMRSATALIFAVPTPVGVNRGFFFGGARLRCRPHARGGEPEIVAYEEDLLEPSPRPWG